MKLTHLSFAIAGFKLQECGLHLELLMMSLSRRTVRPTIALVSRACLETNKCVIPKNKTGLCGCLKNKTEVSRN